MIFSTLTFNMQNGQPWDEAAPDNRSVDIAGTIDFLRSQDADVVFLQEVEEGHDGGRQVEPPPNYTALREALKGYDSVFGYPVPNETEIPFGLGLAIFSKTKLREVRKIDLPAAAIAFDYEGVERRPSERLLLACTTVIGGRSVHLLNTHLQAFFMIRASSDDHTAQRDAVEAELRAVGGPAVLAGDFNCSPQEGLIAQFERAGFQPVQTQEITWRRMPFVLDHIFHNAPLLLERHEVIATTASDHHAVRAEFRFA